MMKTFGKTLLAAVLGSVVTLSAYEVLDQPEKVMVEKEPSYTARVANYEAPDGPQVLADFTVSAEKVTPAVVHITTTMTARGQENMPQVPDFFRDFFGDQFRMQPQQPREQRGSGSGVIISEDGYIVTNNHVVDNADEILVIMNNNREYTAEVIGTDPSTDLALLKVDEEGLPTVPVANSDQIKVGEWVLAVGNPFNLESTVTAGIVSAKGRSINILSQNSANAIESFIQTDAAINPGNSGGALVNLNGDLVGINTAIASPTGSYSGYGFAVPTNIMVKVVDDLMKYGKVQRAFLGIMIRNVNSTLAKEKDLDVMNGVYVDSLMEGGAAKEAGIREGDVIMRVDGKNVRSVPELQEMIGRKRPGDEAEVVVNRSGDEKTLKVALRNLEGTTEIVRASESARVNALGAEFSEIDEKAKDELGIDGGVQVTRIYPGKLRGQTSMREGFIITRIGDKKIHSVKDLEEALAAADGGILIEGYYPGEKETRYFGLGM